jgi:hypothetical protein
MTTPVCRVTTCDHPAITWHLALRDGTVACGAKYPGMWSTPDFRGVVSTDHICPDCTEAGMSKVHYTRARGWQLDYRPDGWLPLDVRNGQRRWWILRLGRFGCVTLGRLE